MRTLLTIAILCVCGCAHQVEVQLLFGPRRTNVTSNTDLGATLLILQRIGESRIHCGYLHSSTLNRGRPLNDRDEVTVDQIGGCGPRWGGRDRP